MGEVVGGGGRPPSSGPMWRCVCVFVERAREGEDRKIEGVDPHLARGTGRQKELPQGSVTQ